MLKNVLRIPDTFDPDERRQRQVLNVLLVFFMLVALIANFRTLTLLLSNAMDSKISPIPQIAGLILLFVLWLMNRAPRIPSQLSGIIFMLFFIGLCTQIDTPSELYNGRSTVIFAIPIMLGAILFPPSYSFLVTLLIWGLMLLFTPSDSRYPTNSINYYSMMILLFIAFISWLGMSIANRAIRDARRHADDAFHHAANLQATLNSIADGVLVLDLQGNFVSANPALLKMIPEEYLRQITIHSFDELRTWKQKVFSVIASPVPNVGSVVVVRDETRRHETERAKDALLAVASHELRTPLAAVMNYLELLFVLVEDGKIDVAKFKVHLMRAIENSSRLHHLVSNILDQAQIQAGMMVLKAKPFDFPALLEKIGQRFESLLQKKGLSYTLKISPDVPAQINTDSERLTQVLVNLLENAIKFTQQGGIQMCVSLSPKETIAIEVIDSGLGIPEEQLPDIFEAFRRGSDYAEREKQGAGLGLSIAKEIITHMGGEISVTSKSGTGSTFTVSLPLKQVQA